MEPGRVIVPLAVCALLALLAGCGADKDDALGNRIAGTSLTIYSSMPLSGASSASGRAVLAGEELALDQSRGRIGKYRILLRSVNDATAQRGEWDPGQTTLNAHQAIQDRSTIGYIGELNSGASAVSIPLLNRLGIPQISPASTAVGLTIDGPGAGPGEPQKYYPTGVRTFARVTPNDQVGAAAMISLQLGLGCKQVYVLEDGEVDGEDTAATFELEAEGSRLKVVAVQMFDPQATDYTSLAHSVAQTNANCVLISAIADEHAALLSKQIAAALPAAMIFGSAGLAESTYADPQQGGIPLTLDPRAMVVVATLHPADAPAAARSFYAAYARRYGPAQPDAIFGYEAMSLMLNAIDRATDRGRTAALRSKVLAAIFATRNRRSVLGTYSIDRNGDTTLRQYGIWTVVDGRLQFWKAIA